LSKANELFADGSGFVELGGFCCLWWRFEANARPAHSSPTAAAIEVATGRNQRQLRYFEAKGTFGDMQTDVQPKRRQVVASVWTWALRKRGQMIARNEDEDYKLEWIKQSP